MNQYPRIENLKSRIAELPCDAFLVTDEINVRYLTGFTGDSSFVLIKGDRVCVLSDGRYTTQLADECRGIETAIRPPAMPMHQLVLDAVAADRVKSLGIEAGGMSLAAFGQLENAFNDVGQPIEFEKTTGVVETLRQVKDDQEIECIKRAIEVAESAFEEVKSNLSTNQTEQEVARDLEWRMRDRGAEGVSFAIIAAFGETGALPHYHPGDRRLGDQPTILIDWGAKVDGYASDITRTLHRSGGSGLGGSGTGQSLDRFRRCYEAVLEAQTAAIDALKPGVTGKEIDEIARDVLTGHGLGDAFLHSLGHGIGLQIHEGPRLAAAGEEPLQAGMVVTVEPGVYFEGDFGIRIEDDVLITPQGAQVLTSLPKGLDDCCLML